MRLIDKDQLLRDLNTGMNIVEMMQTVMDAEEVEPKTGRWINHRCDDGHHIADCDKCGHSLQWFDDDTPKFCCECGVKMEE